MQIDTGTAATLTPPDYEKMTFAEINSVYRKLYELKRSFGPKPNRRNRAEVMIGACILEGFNTGFRITQAMRANGLGKNHVATVLDERTGYDPEVHLWRRDEAGRYHLLT